ncbi:hypothetical protein [Streptomyces sp. NPDC048252]|uniref:hypothetical protein n=1 Tax=Streptomyces sp. NPDC048252 TaxID=3154612 RepID=UPI00343DB74F
MIGLRNKYGDERLEACAKATTVGDPSHVKDVTGTGTETETEPGDGGAAAVLH